jgi:hypothetical protein
MAAAVVLKDLTAFRTGRSLRMTGGVRERKEWVVGGGDRAGTERDRERREAVR